MTDLGQGATPSGVFEHLSCYMPGVLALGARLLDPSYPWPHDPPHARSQSSSSSNFTSDSENQYQPPYSHRFRPRTPVHIDGFELRQTLDLHMRAAKGLAYTCWALYASTESGIGPESVRFDMPSRPEGETAVPWAVRDRYALLQWGPRVAEWEQSGRKGGLVGTEEEAGKKAWKWWRKEGEKPRENGFIPDIEKDWLWKDQRYLLRPEAIEAMYLLWKTTGDKKWRERGWKMFDAANRHTRNEFAYASVHHVHRSDPEQFDDMPRWVSLSLSSWVAFWWIGLMCT
jgi:hypothetical protein